LIISRSVRIGMRNISDKTCRENQNPNFMFNNIFRKSCRLWDNVEKVWQSRTGDRRQYGACTFNAGYLRLQTHTKYM